MNRVGEPDPSAGTDQTSDAWVPRRTAYMTWELLSQAA
jgi:hypothetical protein